MTLTCLSHSPPFSPSVQCAFVEQSLTLRERQEGTPRAPERGLIIPHTL